MHGACSQSMIPAIPTCCCNNRRRWMPAAISHNSLPSATSSIVIISVHKPLVAHWSRIFRRSPHINRLTGHCAVKVPYVYLSVMGARIYVPSICGRWRAEMASDESFEDTVASKCDERAVVWVGGVLIAIVRREAVVEVCCVILRKSSC